MKKQNKKISLFDSKEKCCGCGACYSICPKNAITMKEDNEGFLYPTINYELCVQCKRCVYVCPFKNRLKG